MKVLITGGAGFIGSHLVERCLKEGWTVSVIDDLSTGSLANITPFRKWNTFSYTIDTIFNAQLTAQEVDRCDLVFHLAATVGVHLILKNPVRTIETNAHGTGVVLRAAVEKKKRVILASSSEVYGKSHAVPFREDADLVIGATTTIRWGYACSKMCDEFLAFAYAAEKQLPITVVRFFNTSGPRQISLYGMVIPTLVGQALAGEPLTVFGTGEQQRCFGYVEDVVESLFRIANSSNTVGEVINIGNDEEISINDLAKLVKEITNSKSDIVHVPYEQAYERGFEEVFRRVPSLEKLERLVGYRPTTTVAEIIRSLAAGMAGQVGKPLAA